MFSGRWNGKVYETNKIGNGFMVGPSARGRLDPGAVPDSGAIKNAQESRAVWSSAFAQNASDDLLQTRNPPTQDPLRCERKQFRRACRPA
jgi:hypothetical protein